MTGVCDHCGLTQRVPYAMTTPSAKVVFCSTACLLLWLKNPPLNASDRDDLKAMLREAAYDSGMAQAALVRIEELERRQLQSFDVNASVGFVEMRTRESCANLLWSELMNWCRARGVSPKEYNTLFAIVRKMRHEAE